jgi:NAD(P)-dependent dehydrogenase (short-subunit alcohol dehydrogenase family)
MKGLKGEHIIIGGGATGMGAALALRWVTDGANVVVGDVNEAGLKTLASEFPTDR